MFIYKRTESECWTVGHYDPSGEFVPESDHGTKEEAAQRVALLNGSKGETNLADLTLLAWQALLANPMYWATVNESGDDLPTMGQRAELAASDARAFANAMRGAWDVDEQSTLSEVAFRFDRLTVLAYPRWDRIVLVPLGREPVAVTWREFEAAAKMVQEKHRD